MRKLLIADSSQIFCGELKEVLKEEFQINVCYTGEEALQLILHIRPDVVCLDLLLSGLDGISVLEQVKAAGLRPTILTTTCQDSVYVRASMERLGVDYLMMKPCSAENVVRRLLDICRATEEERIENLFRIDTMLFSLDFRPKLRGFSCVREALLVMMSDPNQAITKEVYPTVAAKCRTDSRCVERVIRSSIKDAWEHRDDSIWQQYFAQGRTGKCQCPSNGNFLAQLTAQLLYEKEQENCNWQKIRNII